MVPSFIFRCLRHLRIPRRRKFFRLACGSQQWQGAVALSSQRVKLDLPARWGSPGLASHGVSIHPFVPKWGGGRGNTPSELKRPIDLSPLAGGTLDKPTSWGSLASLLREDLALEFPRGPGVSGARFPWKAFFTEWAGIATVKEASPHKGAPRR